MSRLTKEHGKLWASLSYEQRRLALTEGIANASAVITNMVDRNTVNVHCHFRGGLFKLTAS